MSKYFCKKCKAIRPDESVACHNCGCVEEVRVLFTSNAVEPAKDRLSMLVKLANEHNISFGQSQVSTEEQLIELSAVANFLGLYDAADVVARMIRR